MYWIGLKCLKTRLILLQIAAKCISVNKGLTWVRHFVRLTILGELVMAPCIQGQNPTNAPKNMQLSW